VQADRWAADLRATVQDAALRTSGLEPLDLAVALTHLASQPARMDTEAEREAQYKERDGLPDEEEAAALPLNRLLRMHLRAARPHSAPSLLLPVGHASAARPGRVPPIARRPSAPPRLQTRPLSAAAPSARTAAESAADAAAPQSLAPRPATAPCLLRPRRPLQPRTSLPAAVRSAPQQHLSPLSPLAIPAMPGPEAAMWPEGSTQGATAAQAPSQARGTAAEAPEDTAEQQRGIGATQGVVECASAATERLSRVTSCASRSDAAEQRAQSAVQSLRQPHSSAVRPRSSAHAVRSTMAPSDAHLNALRLPMWQLDDSSRMTSFRHSASSGRGPPEDASHGALGCSA
jgi:hypothetical protein